MTDTLRTKLYRSYIVAEDLANLAFTAAVTPTRDDKGKFVKRAVPYHAARRISEAWYNVAQSTFDLAWQK